MVRVFDNRIGDFFNFMYPLLNAVNAKVEDYPILSTKSNLSTDGMKISSVDMFRNNKLIARLQPVQSEALFIVTVSYKGESWFNTKTGFTCMRSSAVPITEDKINLLPNFGVDRIVAEVYPII